jgi:hypothetical protein
VTPKIEAFDGVKHFGICFAPSSQETDKMVEVAGYYVIVNRFYASHSISGSFTFGAKEKNCATEFQQEQEYIKGRVAILTEVVLK